MSETMMTYILEEQSVLSSVLKRRKERLDGFLRAAEKTVWDNWVILATGSSANSMLCAKYYVESVAGVRVSIKTNEPFIHYDPPVMPNELVLAVSQSGRSTSTIEALEKASAATSFALTGNMASEISRHAKQLIDIGCGVEKVGYVTKGFSCTMLTFMLMGLEAALLWKRIDQAEYDRRVQDIQNVIGQIPKVIELTNTWYEKMADILCKTQHFVAVGYGPSWGVINEMDTKFTETVRVPVHAREMEEYMHGPYLQGKPEQCLFFFETPGPLSEKLLLLRDYMSEYCGHCLTLSTKDQGDDPRGLYLDIQGDERLLPLLTVVPVQMLAYLIAEGNGSDYRTPKFRDFGEKMKSKYKPQQ